MSSGGDDADSRLARLLAVVEAQGAQLAALTTILAAQSGSAKPAPTISLSDLFAAFEKTHSSDYSWHTVEQRMRPLLRRLGDMPAMALTPFKWAEHATARRAEPTRYDRPPKPKTIDTELMRANQLLAFGVSNGFLPSNPLADVKRERVICARETWLEPAAVLDLLEGCSAVVGHTERETHLNRILIRAFILLCVDSMLRFEEARQLRRDRVMGGDLVDLSAHKTKSRRRRMVGFTPRTLEALADIPTVVGDPHYFVSPITGKLFGQTTIRNWFRAACIASGVDALAVDGERVVIHTLRHSGASAADAAGAAATAIRDGLGHASLATTEKYLHRHRGRGARDLARIIARGPETERRGPQTAPRDEENPPARRDVTPIR